MELVVYLMAIGFLLSILVSAKIIDHLFGLSLAAAVIVMVSGWTDLNSIHGFIQFVLLIIIPVLTAFINIIVVLALIAREVLLSSDDDTNS